MLGDSANRSDHHGSNCGRIGGTPPPQSYKGLSYAFEPQPWQDMNNSKNAGGRTSSPSLKMMDPKLQRHGQDHSIQ